VRVGRKKFAATVYVTVPLPVPEAPLVMVIHELPGATAAVHAQPTSAVIAIVKDAPYRLPMKETLRWSGAAEIAQGGAAAAWVKVKVCPPAVIVAEREVVAELAATE